MKAWPLRLESAQFWRAFLAPDHPVSQPTSQIHFSLHLVCLSSAFLQESVHRVLLNQWPAHQAPLQSLLMCKLYLQQTQPDWSPGTGNTWSLKSNLPYGPTDFGDVYDLLWPTHLSFPFSTTDSLFSTYYFEIYCSFPSTILHNKPIICHFSWFGPCNIFSQALWNPAQFPNVAAIMVFTPTFHKAISSLFLFIKIHSYSCTGDGLGGHLNWYDISNGIIPIQVWLFTQFWVPFLFADFKFFLGF